MFSRKLARLFNRLMIRAVQYPRILLYRSLSTNRIQGNPVRFQPVQFAGQGKIYFQDGVRIGFFPSPFYFSTYAYIEARKPTAMITIGANTYINNNFRAIAEAGDIRIGQNCLIGTNVEILDSDFHPLKPEERASNDVSLPLFRSVIIGSNVFIGSNVTIMKGVTIGDGSVVANGSIVTRSVPSRRVVGGVPAKIIKTLD